ncbi:AI-2E family transporter [Gemelliphila asaccharolytica]|uniref:AI-2E family transporter n=1 Tax=Gemelliphila asaccharolytica TaxID=502393 RepID=A0ABR5TPU3_9BACL|nr:AI-2E family transporter [Gemella asaccharolytica]KXB58861.1 hypothetical protein HMPREF1871_00174 [Gemella asaccharolytica]
MEEKQKKIYKLNLKGNKEKQIISFLGGKITIYVLTIIILFFIALFLYKQISGVFAPVRIIFSSLIAPVLVAYIFFYILKPVSNLLANKLKMSRAISSILSILFGILVIVLVFIGVIPVIVEQTQHLIVAIPEYVFTLKRYLEANSNNIILRNILYYINNNLNVTKLSSTAFDIFSNFITNAASILSSTATIIITVPFVLYYLLKDSEKFKDFVIKKLPEKSKNPIKNTIEEIDNTVGSYIAGQMLVSLCVGILLFIGYQIIGLKYAVSLATLAALLSIVPYLGPMIAILPAMLVAIGTDWIMVVKMLVVWGVVQFLEANVISPNIMGRKMEIHPLTVIFVIIIFTNMMGVVGAIIGIPLYGILKVIVIKIFVILKNRYIKIVRDNDKL